jgi:hypothetical protein
MSEPRAEQPTRSNDLRNADAFLRRARDVGRTPIQVSVNLQTAIDGIVQLRDAGADLFTMPPGLDAQRVKKTVAILDRPCGVVVDERNLATVQAMLDCGVTYLSARGDRFLDSAASQIDALDALIGKWEAGGRRIVREKAPPPGLRQAGAIALAVCEAQLALEQGVRTFVATLPLRGAFLEDIAGLHVLRTLMTSWIAPNGGFRFFLSAAALPGDATREVDRGYAFALNNALAAAVGGADLYSANPFSLMSADALQPLLDGVQCARQMFVLSAGQALEAAGELARAENALEQEVLAILGNIESKALRGHVPTIAGRLRAQVSDAVTGADPFPSLPRFTPEGMVDTPLPRWSDDPLARSQP